jgi:hypothetical protein
MKSTKKTISIVLNEGKDDELSLLVGRNGSIVARSQVDREACPHCQDVECQTTCIDSIPEPGEDVDSDIFDRIAHNGKLDGAEAAFIAVISALVGSTVVSKFDAALFLAECKQPLEDAWNTTLDGIRNSDK